MKRVHVGSVVVRTKVFPFSSTNYPSLIGLRTIDWFNLNLQVLKRKLIYFVVLPTVVPSVLVVIRFTMGVRTYGTVDWEGTFFTGKISFCYRPHFIK